MPTLEEMVVPATAAVVTVEMQRGVIGDRVGDNTLKAEVDAKGIIPAAQRLVIAARAAGVRVVHATITMRADRAALTINNAMMAMSVKNPHQVLEGSEYGELIPELGPEPPDIVCNRIHGLTPFTGTELDPILRNIGTRTIIPVGVSVNEALLGTCLTAADLGYQIALPVDAIAGVPGDYADAVVLNTLALIARRTTVDDVIAAWNG
ncbi:MAG TPA: cysteine hydrolase [Frankiaceae bacterium]|jgi:nicotinamidase-related amidase|nr:cysteine hydrolase [Frankiaceae bacterium]